MRSRLTGIWRGLTAELVYGAVTEQENDSGEMSGFWILSVMMVTTKMITTIYY